MAHPWHWQTPEPDDHLFVPVDRLAAAASKRDPDPTWRRTTWGRYVPTSTSTSVEQRILNQAARLGPRQAVTGWAALRLWGAGLFDGCGPDGVTEVPVPLAVGADGQLDQHLGGVISYVRLPAQDVRDLNGFAVATVARAVFDEVRRVGGIRAGVGVIDTAVVRVSRHSLTSPAGRPGERVGRVSSECGRRCRWRGPGYGRRARPGCA